MQTILLSGVSGFLGSNLAETLHKNYKIIGLKRSTSNCHRLQNLTIKTYNIDKIKLDSIFDKHKIDIIIHTATCYGRRGEPLSHLVETNLVFSLKLLELARKFSTKAFINADTLQLDSVSNYTISKRTLRDYLHNFNDINLINCRIEHIYGNDKDNSKFSTYLLNAFSDDVPCIPLTSGRQRRDFIYIDDAIMAFELILRSAMERRNERSYDIGSGEFISVRSFAECLLSEFRKHKACKTRLDFGAIPYTNLGEIKENLAPLRALGFMAKYSYQSGIRALIEAYLQNHDAKVCTAKNSAVKNHTAKTTNAKNRKWGGAAESSNTLQPRHYERSEVIHKNTESSDFIVLDYHEVVPTSRKKKWIATRLKPLAMTILLYHHYERSEVIHKNTESSDKKDLLYGLPRLEAIAESSNDDSTLTVFARLWKKPKQSNKRKIIKSTQIFSHNHKAILFILNENYKFMSGLPRLDKVKSRNDKNGVDCHDWKLSQNLAMTTIQQIATKSCQPFTMTPSVAFGLPPMTTLIRFHAKIAESRNDKLNSDSTAIFTRKLHKSHTLKAVA